MTNCNKQQYLLHLNTESRIEILDNLFKVNETLEYKRSILFGRNMKCEECITYAICRNKIKNYYNNSPQPIQLYAVYYIILKNICQHLDNRTMDLNLTDASEIIKDIFKFNFENKKIL